MSDRCPKCGSPKNEHRNLICGNAVRPDGSAYRTSLCDYIAALRAQLDACIMGRAEASMRANEMLDELRAERDELVKYRDNDKMRAIAYRRVEAERDELRAALEECDRLARGREFGKPISEVAQAPLAPEATPDD